MKLELLRELAGIPKKLNEDANVENDVKALMADLEKAGWKKTSHTGKAVEGSNYSVKQVPDTNLYTFFVAVAENKAGEGLSGKLLSGILDKYFREYRSKDWVFTQPVGLSGSGWEYNGSHGTCMSFTMGK